MPNPQRDMARLHLLRRYLKNRRTLLQIRKRFALSQRTAYRWLSYLREEGVTIITIRTEGRLYFREL